MQTETKVESAGIEAAEEKILRRAVHISAPIHWKDGEPNVSRNTLYRAAEKLVLKKQLFKCGTKSIKGNGRPPGLYCTEKVPSNKIDHEFGCTQYLNRHRWLDIPCLRGTQVDKALRPDWTFLVDPILHGEWDTGSEPHWQVLKRLKKFEGCGETVLFVTQSAKRLHALHHVFAQLADVELLMTCYRWDYCETMCGQKAPLEELVE